MPGDDLGYFKLHLPPLLGLSDVAFSKAPLNGTGRVGGSYVELKNKKKKTEVTYY